MTLAHGNVSGHQKAMNGYDFTLAGASMTALPSGALWWPDRRLLTVSDLHLGKSNRYAQMGGAPLPPYENRETLSRLERDIDTTGAQTIICLGDSFDDLAAAKGLPEGERDWITRLQAGRRWVWIEGNHDPGPINVGGSHLRLLPEPPLTFRHIAMPWSSGEVSGHYHPKARVQVRGRMMARPCFLLDSDRLILPAYGTYTGGLRSDDKVLQGLMRAEAVAILTGTRATPIPMPR